MHFENCSFLDPENGYVGLGTDWSMGTEELLTSAGRMTAAQLGRQHL